MQSWFIIALCCLVSFRAATQNTPTPEDIQQVKDAVIARQQAYTRGEKDTGAPDISSPDVVKPLPIAVPAPTGQTGMDYAHTPMFKKCRVAVSFGTATGDTASNRNEQTNSGSNQTGSATMKLTMYASNLMGRTVLAGGPDGIIDVAANGKLQASGYSFSPSSRTSYTRSGFAVSNPLPSVAFTYDSDTSWSASVTLNYAISSNSNLAVITDRTSITIDADQSNATLRHKNGDFSISRKIADHSIKEAGGRKEMNGETGTFTMNITTDR